MTLPIRPKTNHEKFCLWIHQVLPVAFCLVPVLMTGLLFAAIPSDARRDYLSRVKDSPIDWIILALGFTLFIAQTYLAWRALRWQTVEFDGETPPCCPTRTWCGLTLDFVAAKPAPGLGIRPL